MTRARVAQGFSQLKANIGGIKSILDLISDCERDVAGFGAKVTGLRAIHLA